MRRVGSSRFPALLQRRLAVRRSGAGVADLVRDPRHLLGALAEDVPLELLDGALERGDALAQRGDRLGGFTEPGGGSGEQRLEALGLLPPLAPMVVTAHRRL
jgi:hypothetical protein